MDISRELVRIAVDIGGFDTQAWNRVVSSCGDYVKYGVALHGLASEIIKTKPYIDFANAHEELVPEYELDDFLWYIGKIDYEKGEIASLLKKSGRPNSAGYAFEIASEKANDIKEYMESIKLKIVDVERVVARNKDDVKRFFYTLPNRYSGKLLTTLDLFEMSGVTLNSAIVKALGK